MVVGIDGAAQTQTGCGVSSINWSHTVGTNTNRLLLVFVSWRGFIGVDSVTYGAATVDLVRQDFNGADSRSAIYRLIDPTDGTDTVTVNFSGNCGPVGASLSLFDVDTADPIETSTGTTGNGTTSSVSVTSSADSLVLDNLSIREFTGNASITGDQTAEEWDLNSNCGVSTVNGAGSQADGATSVTMSWSWTQSKDFATTAVSINESVPFETFLSDTQSLTDDVLTELLKVISQPLDDSITTSDDFFKFGFLHINPSDTVYSVDVSNFDEVRFDGAHFDQRVDVFIDFGRRISDVINVVDELFRKYILHRFGDETLSIVDNPRYIMFLHRFADETLSVVDNPRYTTFLHRLLSESLPLADDLRYTTFLHRFASETQSIVDEIFVESLLIFSRLLDDSITLVDDPRYTTFLHRFSSEVQSLLDEISTNVTFGPIRLSDTIFPVDVSNFDEVRFDGARFDQRVQLVFDLVRVFSEVQPVVDGLFRKYILHRFGDDTQTVLDEVFRKYVLHRFVSETQSITDEAFLEFILRKIQLSETTNIVDDLFRFFNVRKRISEILTVLDDLFAFKEGQIFAFLGDTVYTVDESRFDEVRFDGARFDQRVQLIFDLHRFFSEVLTLVDTPRYTTILHRFISETQSLSDSFSLTFIRQKFLSEIQNILDDALAEISPIKHKKLLDSVIMQSLFDDGKFDIHKFDTTDKIRITYILHRFFAELLALSDDLIALRVAIRRLSDAFTLADTFEVFEGGLPIPFGSILRLHRLSGQENALLLFPLDVGVDQSERTEEIQIPFADSSIIQATGTSAKRIRVDCLWVENEDQDEGGLKANLKALQNANQIKVTFFLQRLLTKDYRPVKLETFSVQKLRGRSDILRVRLMFIEDSN